MFRLGYKRCFRSDLINKFGFRQSSRDVTAIEDSIVVTDDGSTIVCWHPEKMYPYEFTKPMPEYVSQPRILKTSKEEAMKLISKKGTDKEIAEECAKLTNTTFHRWLPRSRDKKVRKIPPQRPFL
ncbi:large ribosomal subunit protein mL42 [Halyomorpha halys]|uniref:large ribosomal subunit protein mL42 n=1 Tax=Halyomorpha halys TaxID=286706 RepID=UPI0006D4E558|nr:39S ribosomal protein L42, mitochondrial [Halyomorpha halys]